MATVYSVLASPVVEVFIALVLGALAVSGKLSLIAAEILLTCAAFVGSFGIVNAGFSDRGTISAIFGVVILCLSLGYWIQRKEPQPYGKVASRRIDQQTIEALTKLMTQAGALFEAGQRAATSYHISAWNTKFDAWFGSAREMIKTKISESEAVLFTESPGGMLVGHHRDPRHNQSLNTLLGYQNALRHIIERYSDR